MSHVPSLPDTDEPLPRAHPSTLRAALWAYRAVRVTRRGYSRGLDADFSLPTPPAVPPGAYRGVLGILRRTGASCLIASRVRQDWAAAHGRRRELIIGVTAPARGFRAHAWLDGDPPCEADGFTELARRGPQVVNQD